MSLIDIVQQSLGPDAIQQISREIGADPAATAKAVEAALPLMVNGISNAAAQAPEAASTIQTFADTGGAQTLGGLGGVLGGLGAGGLGGILGGILGDKQDSVQDGVQKASGLDAGKVGKLLMVLAPLVIRALAKHQAAPTAQADGGLADAPPAQAKNPAGSPDLGGMLGNILGGLRN